MWHAIEPAHSVSGNPEGRGESHASRLDPSLANKGGQLNKLPHREGLSREKMRGTCVGSHTTLNNYEEGVGAKLHRPMLSC